MTDQELLDQIRQGVTQQMSSAITANVDQITMHLVTQSYLLLKMLDLLASIRVTQIEMRDQLAKIEQQLESHGEEYE